MTKFDHMQKESVMLIGRLSRQLFAQSLRPTNVGAFAATGRSL